MNNFQVESEDDVSSDDDSVDRSSSSFSSPIFRRSPQPYYLAGGITTDLTNVHQRVTNLQRQIDNELDTIAQAWRYEEQERRYPSLHEQARTYDVDRPSSNDDDDANSDDSGEWPSPSPALALTQQRPGGGAASVASSSSSSSSTPSRPPPRATTRVTAHFSPSVSAAERARRAEEEEQQRQQSPSVDQIRIGSLNVRLDRAESLRQEMAVLSALFENVRQYQTTLVESLHQAGFVDDSQMARLPQLHVGFIHQLIESAWVAAAARNGNLDAALFQSFNEATLTTPQLPVGHAERVAKLPSRTLAVASSDDCCICIDAMGVDAVVSSLDACQHMFHTSCIKEWLNKANTCPLCKRVAIEDPNTQSTTITPPTVSTAQEIHAA